MPKLHRCRDRLAVGLDADRDQHGLHQTTTTAVVIRIGRQPERQAEQSDNPAKDQQFDHGISITRHTLAAPARADVAKAAVSPTWPGWALAKALAGILGDTGLELFAKFGVVQVLANQHDLVLAFAARPFRVVDGEALAGQVEHVAALAFVEPENSFGSEHRSGHQIVEKVLEFAQGKGSFGHKRQRRKPFNGEVISALVLSVIMALIVGVAVVMGVAVPMGMGVIVGMTVAVVMAMPVIVPVIVVFAVAMVVVAILMALLGHDFVAFEQSHAQQQR